MKQETGTSRTSPTTLGVRKSTGKKEKTNTNLSDRLVFNLQNLTFLLENQTKYSPTIILTGFKLNCGIQKSLFFFSRSPKKKKKNKPPSPT